MMKTINAIKFLILVVMSGFLLTTSSCKDDPTAEDIFRKKIALAWKSSPTGVQFDGKDVNGVFKDFTITFTEAQTFTTTAGNAPVWAASGKFTIKAASSATGFNLLRDDGLEVIVDKLTDAQLVLKFPYVGKSSRVKSVSGGFVFDLVVK
ncbi:MAG: hypothetical protein JJE09_14665 [Bacteroidia bacterium]|nr:hypothetical protein [Bacteroidia bacterium]